MPFNLPFFSTAPNSYGAESQEDIDMYNAESEGNFRGIESHLRSVSSYQLTDADLCSDDDVRLLSVYGAFAELSHGCFDVGLIWQLMPMLLQPGGMLEEYGCLENSKLLCVFKGANWAGLQGYVVHRWADDGEEEILVSFSGTSNLVQGLYDVWALKTGYPIPLSWQSYTAKRPKAHAGFWSIYSGLRATVAHEMAQARKIHPGARRLVITGHSLGAAMCYLAALDILFAGFEGDYSDRSGFRDMSGMQIVLAVFGCPRVGNEWLVSQYQAAIAAYKDSYGGQLAFIEYSVKGFQDGVSSVPPISMGYRHFCASPLYSYHGQLYRTPEGQQEHTMFNVLWGDTTRTRIHFRGGHNYFNRRSMEKLHKTFKEQENHLRSVLIFMYPNLNNY